MIYRILTSFLLLFSILFMPLWVSFLLAFLGIIYFNFFWEVVILFLISNLLYGAKQEIFANKVFISLVISIVILLTIEATKRKVKFYPAQNDN